MDNQQKEITTKSVFHHITNNVPTVSPRQTIGIVKKSIVNPEKIFDSINYIYVLDDNQKLVGVVSIKELLALPEDTRVAEVMKTNVIYVHPHTHSQKAVHLSLSHNIKQIPVLNKEGKFLGIVASDILLRIANNELDNSIMQSTGVNTKEYKDIATLTNSPWHLTWRRLPWLVLGLIGGIFAARVVGFFEVLLEKEKVLISFLPLMVYMSDAVGGQSQTILIRYIALANDTKFGKYLFKEMGTGVLIATALSAGLGGISALIYNPYLGLVMSVALFCTIMFSIVIAILIPWILVKAHKDPAIGSGPFATIIRDLASIIIYFSVSSIFYSF